MIENRERTEERLSFPSSFASFHTASVNHGQRLMLGWDSFCDAVKHRRRYLFSQETFTSDDRVPVSDMFDELGSLVIRRELVRELPQQTIIFRMRIRRRDEMPSDLGGLGPPPVYRTVANRMSPAGVSLFYGALEEDTARDEAFSSRRLQSSTLRKYGNSSGG
jgi:hypothetical protein